jgi:hypothetical protein
LIVAVRTWMAGLGGHAPGHRRGGGRLDHRVDVCLLWYGK